jgi:hypothetical protein
MQMELFTRYVAHRVTEGRLYTLITWQAWDYTYFDWEVIDMGEVLYG